MYFILYQSQGENTLSSILLHAPFKAYVRDGMVYWLRRPFIAENKCNASRVNNGCYDAVFGSEDLLSR